MIGLWIFAAIAICGGIFLIYVLAAFWRELRSFRKKHEVHIVELRPRHRLTSGSGKLLAMDMTDLIRVSKRKIAGRA